MGSRTSSTSVSSQSAGRQAQGRLLTCREAMPPQALQHTLSSAAGCAPAGAPEGCLPPEACQLLLQRLLWRACRPRCLLLRIHWLLLVLLVPPL